MICMSIAAFQGLRVPWSVAPIPASKPHAVRTLDVLKHLRFAGGSKQESLPKHEEFKEAQKSVLTKRPGPLTTP